MIVIKTDKSEIKLKKEQAVRLVTELNLLLAEWKHEPANVGSWVKYTDYVVEIR
jgi:hypothetical protein